MVIGGGCFWCTEALYEQVKGVSGVVSGYAGGHTAHPTYDQVCDGNTGHAEVVQISYEPSLISYRELLEIFYAIHDPTTPNRQGNDVGPQYRSIILYANDEQKQIAEAVTQGFAAAHWDKPITTEIRPLEKFWPAEDYHQDYYLKNPEVAYCQVIINSKLAKFKQAFAAKLK